MFVRGYVVVKQLSCVSIARKWLEFEFFSRLVQKASSHLCVLPCYQAGDPKVTLYMWLAHHSYTLLATNTGVPLSHFPNSLLGLGQTLKVCLLVDVYYRWKWKPETLDIIKNMVGDMKIGNYSWDMNSVFMFWRVWMSRVDYMNLVLTVS